MTFSPLARFKNFTVGNLKALLELYPDMSGQMAWNDAREIIQEQQSCYKKTACQMYSQFGIENRGEDNFKIQEYVFFLNDKGLRNYADFWFKLYYAPNPYTNVSEGDTTIPKCIFTDIASKILNSSNYEISYKAYFDSAFGGGSGDILLNCIKEYGNPIKLKPDGDTLYVLSENINELRNVYERIETEFPIINYRDRTSFFSRFGIDNFKKFYGLKSINDLLKKQKKNNIFSAFQYSGPRNLIVFGAPGTGKSYMLEQYRKELMETHVDAAFERITFHPAYTYANFVGAYKPVMEFNGNENVIAYKFVPGPFTRILVKALKNPNAPYLLLIEEINRANVAAVFGEVFQLLDRLPERCYESQYSINASEDLYNYLRQELGENNSEICSELRIPGNMFIWASMNSADQGVFPMDTAFKRRWDFKYINIDDGEDKIINRCFTVGKEEINWNALRKAINIALVKQRVNEDKLMGPFFISKSMVDNATNDEFVELFKNKVIMYLFEDAARQRRNEIFENNGVALTYSQICNNFEKHGRIVFSELVNSEYSYDSIKVVNNTEKIEHEQ